MLTLNDGRAELWQWDTGRTLAVDADCSQVHFSNKVFGRSIDVDVVNGVAIIPDVLLQTDKDLNVWAFVGTAENGYTKISKTFKVNRRNKPADYVFTPPDQTTLAELSGRIDRIEESQDPDAIKNAVADYISKNPITVEETDPTVPAWAKEAQKPSYTASEVGADPSGTAAAQVTAHNSGTDTHSDIRLLISGLTDRLNALADSDDTTLDQLSEVVAYIKSNRELIASITTDKVSVSDIIDNLTTNVENKPLSAAQGVALKSLIDGIVIPDKLPNPNALTFTGAVTGSYDGSAPLSVEIPRGGGDGGNKPTIIFDSGEITEEVNIIGPIDISKYSRIRIFGKVYPSSNSAGKRALQIYFQNHNKRLLCNTGNGKLFDTAGNPVSFLIYLCTSANAISTHSYSGYNAGTIFDDADYAVSSMASSSDGGSLVYSTKYDFTQMHLSAQDDLSTRPFGIGTRIMVIGDE